MRFTIAIFVVLLPVVMVLTDENKGAVKPDKGSKKTSAVDSSGEKGGSSRIFDGETWDFEIFGQDYSIPILKVPTSLEDFTDNIAHLRSDPFLRTFFVIFLNIASLFVFYTILILLNIHLALKHRRAAAAAHDRKPMFNQNVRINIPTVTDKLDITGSMMNLTNGSVPGNGRVERNRVERKLSFGSDVDDDDELPRLVGESISYSSACLTTDQASGKHDASEQNRGEILAQIERGADYSESSAATVVEGRAEALRVYDTVAESDKVTYENTDASASGNRGYDKVASDRDMAPSE